MSDDLTLLREAFAARGHDATPGPDCPEHDELYAAAHGELAPRALAPLLEHVRACGACAEAWRLAMALDVRETTAEIIPLFPRGTPPARPEPSPTPSSATPTPAPPAGHDRARRVAALVLAAVGSVAALVALAVLPTYLEAPDPSWQAGAPQLVTSQPELTVAAGEQAELTWSGPPGAVYGVLVTDAGGAPLTEAQGLEESRYVVPAEVLDAVDPGSTLLWRVEGRSPSGETIASPTWTLRVVR